MSRVATPEDVENWDFANGGPAVNASRNPYANIVDATPPSDSLAESCSLGSVLVDDAAFDDIAAHVGEFDYTDEKHRIISAAMKIVRESGQRIDVATVQSQLKAMGTLGDGDDQVMLGDLMKLVADVPHSANAGHYAEAIREAADKRKLHTCGLEIARQALNGTTSGKLLEYVRGRIDAIGTRPGDLDFDIMSTAELEAGDYDVEFYIEDVLVARQPMILAGARKSLKTSILIEMAVALALGDMFLRRFVVNGPRRVLIFSGESGGGTIRETCRRVVQSHGYTMDDLRNLFWSMRVPKLGDAGHLDALRTQLKRHAIEVVAVDPAYLALPNDDPGNLFAQGELLAGVAAACQESGVTLIICHHTKKTVVNPFQPVELEDIAWAGFQEFARQWTLISRRTPYDPGTGEHRLWLTFGGSVGHSSLWGLDINEGIYSKTTPRFWEPTIRTVSDARESAKRGEEKSKAASKENKEADAREAVRKVLAKHPDGCTKTELKALTHLHTDKVTLAVMQLTEAGAIEPCQTSKGNKQTYAGYRLTDEQFEIAAKLAAVDSLAEPDATEDEVDADPPRDPSEINESIGF